MKNVIDMYGYTARELAKCSVADKRYYFLLQRYNDLKQFNEPLTQIEAKPEITSSIWFYVVILIGLVVSWQAIF